MEKTNGRLAWLLPIEWFRLRCFASILFAIKKINAKKVFEFLTLLPRSIACFSYVLMILLDLYNKMADYYINRPFFLMISLDIMKS